MAKKNPGHNLVLKDNYTKKEVRDLLAKVHAFYKYHLKYKQARFILEIQKEKNKYSAVFHNMISEKPKPIERILISALFNRMQTINDFLFDMNMQSKIPKKKLEGDKNGKVE